MSEPQTRLSDFLPYLLSITSNAVSDRIAEEYHARFGLKIAEWRVMAVLGDLGGQTQRELVGATRMDKVAVNRACKVLEQRKLIARSPNDRDGRSHHLELTDAGRSVFDEIMPIALAMEDRLFAPLKGSDRDKFKALLAQVRAQAQGKD
ncbi:MarR family transcriptional regulator [Novosphingobium sp.]|uniref:MarR family winged helix-turn-helix transcriptional regulator n=1 Tax=Novosphingobium sp. TaxID=1874826 RepID=UPI00286C97F9|nr:MarR family transcriptional regulator [Novosphingobium sp.]